MAQMNILISSEGFFPHSFGGGENYVYLLAKELLSRGHAVTVITSAPWGQGDADYMLSDWLYENIPVTSFSVNPCTVAYAETTTGHGPVMLKALRSLLENKSPDLVHINGIKPAFVHLCNEAKIPHVVTTHHTGIVCPAGDLIRPDGTVCSGDMNPRKCVYCCNLRRRPKWYSGGLIGLMPSWVYRPLGEQLGKSRKLNYIERGLITPWLIERTIREKRTVLQDAHYLIAPSNFMNDFLVKNGCNPHKITVIPHGVEIMGKISLQAASSRVVRFGYVGRIDPSKGLHVLLEAAELLASRPCEVHIFGAARNSWHDAYRKKILKEYRGKARVIDHGRVSHHSLKEAYAQIDVLVVPSLLPEAFGLVIAEAFSADRPVIVFNSGALSELVTHGENGFIVEENNCKSLARAMQKFVDDPKLIMKMSMQIPQVKTIQAHVDNVENMYFQVINKCLTIK